MTAPVAAAPSRPALDAEHTFPKLTPPQIERVAARGRTAVGDVRAGNIERVASAVGEGSIAISFVHQTLQE